MVVTAYKCSECGAEDHDRTDNPPPALHCWNCGGGRTKPGNRVTTVTDILMSQVGMLKQQLEGDE